MDAKPMPDPSATRISDAAAATNAPAMMDGHEAADLAAGDPEPSAMPAPGMIISSMMLSLIVRTHRQQENDRKRNAQHPKQYSATHGKPLVCRFLSERRRSRNSRNIVRRAALLRHLYND
jgi:hypothetical protein